MFRLCISFQFPAGNIYGYWGDDLVQSMILHVIPARVIVMAKFKWKMKVESPLVILYWLYFFSIRLAHTRTILRKVVVKSFHFFFMSRCLQICCYGPFDAFAELRYAVKARSHDIKENNLSKWNIQQSEHSVYVYPSSRYF